MGLRWKQPVTVDEQWAILRWRLAQATGWSLEYIDELSYADIREYLAVADAEAKSAPGWKG